jgi:hypothetical protein
VRCAATVPLVAQPAAHRTSRIARHPPPFKKRGGRGGSSPVDIQRAEAPGPLPLSGRGGSGFLEKNLI